MQLNSSQNVCEDDLPRLFLHVGTHKTGTTSIQNAASANRDELASKGLCYPNSCEWFDVDPRLQSSTAHFAFAKALTRLDAVDQRQLGSFKDHILERLDHGMNVLISAESLFRHVIIEGKPGFGTDRSADRRRRWRRGRELFVERLASYLERIPVEVVLYLRRPDSFMESMYSEAMSSTGVQLDFSAYVEDYSSRSNYNLEIELFSRFWKINIFNFESIKRELPAGFFTALGLPVPPDLDSDVKRVSIPKAAVLWMLEARKSQEPSNLERKRRWIFALQHENRALFQADEASTFWKSTSMRDAFLASTGLKFGDICFDHPSQLPPTCTWSTDEHAEAERRFKLWQLKNADWLAERKANLIAAFVDAQAPR